MEDGGLAATRRRSANIDLCLDMIPARFYLDTEHHQKTLDPALVKTTSQLVKEAAMSVSTETDKKAVKPKRRKKQQRNGSAAPAEKNVAQSRKDLHEKLERRIHELREERLRKQMAVKAKQAEAKTKQAEAKTPPKRQLQDGADKARQAEASDASAQPKRARTDAGGDVEDEAELHLRFEAKRSSLPYEATVNRPGNKVQRLRAEFRKREAEGKKIREAEEQGCGQEVRREFALQKALMRARGEKVHDDPQKLRKAQKNLDLKRKKGKDKWNELQESEKQQKEEQQQKRKDNLEKRRSHKRKGKRSGFEGNRPGFLNSDK